MIDVQLKRLRFRLPKRFHIYSNQTRMVMIADWAGLSITIPLCYVRAKGFRRHVTLHSFPDKGFARDILLFAVTQASLEIIQFLRQTFVALVETSEV